MAHDKYLMSPTIEDYIFEDSWHDVQSMYDNKDFNDTEELIEMLAHGFTFMAGTMYAYGENPDIEATHIESTMEEIAAAVVKSGDVPVPVDLTAIKTDLVVAIRAELQAVMEADLRPMIKAAIAEALQERPTTQPKPRAKKAASGKAAKTKAVTRAKKAPAAKKSND